MWPARALAAVAGLHDGSAMVTVDLAIVPRKKPHTWLTAKRLAHCGEAAIAMFSTWPTR